MAGMTDGNNMTDRSKDIVIRTAGPADAETIARLIRELADFENLLHEVKTGAADVLRDGFGGRPYFECLLAEAGGEAVGFALFFFTYSTFEGRPSLYVEDLYMAERVRGLKLGRRMMARLAEIALERDCPRLDLAVLDWNPARGFYDRLGFAHRDDWLSYRLEGEALRKLAQQA